MLKVSIITVVLNRKETIGYAIKSVKSQSYQNIEYIILDGLSTDGTTSLIESLISKDEIFFSDKDLGLYDALNKAIKISSGEVIGVLHSDDIYSDNSVVEKIAVQFLDPSVDIVYGDAVFFNPLDRSKVVRYYKSGHFSKTRLSFGLMPAHSAMFFRKKLFDRYGLYKTDYKIASDFEFLARLLSIVKINAKYIAEPLIRMQTGGISSFTLKNFWKINLEVLQACRENNIPTNFFKILSKSPFKILELKYLTIIKKNLLVYGVSLDFVINWSLY
jgi:glycosyltransferase involved in cell wall biosynthesis